VPRRGTPVAPPEPWEFDPELLRMASRQSEAWKQTFGFPQEVTGVRLAGAEDLDWKAVVLDQPEYLFTAFIDAAAPAAKRQLLGFAIKIEGWALETGEPAVAPGAGWEAALPDLATDPSEAEWRGAWQVWGQQRGLPPAEMGACKLERSGCLLRVEVPRKLMARLRETRSDALRGETWLLAGSGRSRAAARVELTERDG
jgi:hypothetical protein